MAIDWDEKYVSFLASGGSGSESDPWDLNTAATNATGAVQPTRVNVQFDGDYVVPANGLQILGTGSWAGPFPFDWRGFHVTPGDMCFGGDKYQSAFDRYITGSSLANSKVHINSPSGSFSTLRLSSPYENIGFENFVIDTKTGGSFFGIQGWASGGGGYVRNCFGIVGSNVFFVESGSSSGEGVLQTGNYCTGGLIMRNGLGDCVGCIVEGAGRIEMVSDGFCHHNIVDITGVSGVVLAAGAGNSVIYNNLIVGATTAAINPTGAFQSVIEHNNIIIAPAADDRAVINRVASGGNIRTDHSLAYCITGDPFSAPPWYDVKNGVDVIGPNSILDVDPLLITEGGKYVGLDLASPCFFAGQPIFDRDADADDPNRANKQGHIGPFNYPGARGQLSASQHNNLGRMVI